MIILSQFFRGGMHDLEISYILSIVTQLLNDHLKIRTYLSDPRASQVVQWCRKNSPANAGDTGDMGLSPGSGRYSGGGNSSPLQYSFLENPMDRGAWRATVHGFAKSWTQLSTWACIHLTQSLCFKLLHSTASHLLAPTWTENREPSSVKSRE